MTSQRRLTKSKSASLYKNRWYVKKQLHMFLKLHKNKTESTDNQSFQYVNRLI